MKKLSYVLTIIGIFVMFTPTIVFGQTPRITLSPIENPPPTNIEQYPKIDGSRPMMVCPFDSITLRQGDNGENVRTLQSILAQDPTIYPQGLVTGYLGSLTQDAIRKLQQKSDLPQTGIIDAPTRNIIFPCTTISIISPNGGEAWRTGETYQIKWQMQAPYYQVTNSQTQGTSLRATFPQKGTTAPSGTVYPFFRNINIDLIESGNVVYHIGSASLYDDTSLTWAIPSSIPQSSSYKIRVSLWKNVPLPFDCKREVCPMTSQLYPSPWQGYTWDESDAFFTIAGGTIPPPPPPDNTSLRQIRQQIADALNQLQNALALLDKLLNGNISTSVSPAPICLNCLPMKQ